MQYKGFTAKCFYASDAGVFVGEVINTPAVIAFSAMTMASLRETMIEAIENYLEKTNALTLFSIGSVSLGSLLQVSKTCMQCHTI